MKRILSLVLALVIVLGTMPMAFAEVGTTETNGELLKAAGFIEGDDYGNLMEEKTLTRAELCVLVAELNGVKEIAQAYTMPANFSDVKADDWFAPYVAYAVSEGWFNGLGDGQFGPEGEVTSQMLATVMMRALGYTPNWDTAIAEAAAIDLTVDAAGKTMTRGEAFVTLWQTVNTPKKGSDVKLGVELGKLEEEAPVAEDLVAVVDGVKGVANNLVEVEFTEAVDADSAGTASNYTIVEKADATKELAIVSATVESDTIVVLETEAMTAGKGYTVIVGESKENFSGVKKETKAPAVDSVKGTDSGEVEVVFEDALVDRATAQDVANYSIDKEGTVVAASLNDDRDTVTLTVEGLTSTSAKKLTIENVASTDGVVMKKTTRSFGPKFDTVAPKIDKVYSSKENNVEVIVDFTDTHGVDKATAEDVANYSIDGLEILSAKAGYQNGDVDDYYNRIVLTTSEQTKSKKYVLKVLYMMDGSTAKNATTKVLDEDFRGGSADSDEPEIKSNSDVVARNLTEIAVTFTENNALDLATALDAGNYTFKDDALDVVGVALEDADENGNSYDLDISGAGGQTGDDLDKITVIITVSEMEEKTYYRLQINNIADNFGNAMDKQVEKSVRIAAEIKAYSQIESITCTDLEKVVVVFADDLVKASANDATNYVLDGGIGAVKKASRSSSKNDTVTLTVPKLTENKTYELTVNNVENFWGYAAEDVTFSFKATKDGVDTTQPEVDGVEYTNRGELRITFSEPMQAAGSVVVKNTDTGLPYTLPYAASLEDDTILVFNASFTTDVPATPGAVLLVADINDEFEITSFSALVKDLAGNAVDYTTTETFTVEDGVLTATSDDRVSNDGLSQENGNVIHATFDRKVNKPLVGSTITANVLKIDGDTPSSAKTVVFDVQRDDDDSQILILTAKSPSKFDDKTWELEFDFSSIITVATDKAVTDILGRAVKSEKVTIDVDNDDETGPSITELKVVDRSTIKLYFDEKLSSKGAYKIVDLDDDKSNVGNNSVLKDADTTGNVVQLNLSKNLDSDHTYELTITSTPRDLNGNNLEDYADESYEFVGSDVVPGKDAVTAKVMSANEILLTSTGDDFAATKNVNVSAKDSLGNVIVAASTLSPAYTSVINKVTAASDELKVDVPMYYSLLSKTAGGNAVTYKVATVDGALSSSHIFQTFTGLIEEDKATTTAVTSTNVGDYDNAVVGDLVIDCSGMAVDMSNYYYRVYDSTDSLIASSLTADIAGTVKSIKDASENKFVVNIAATSKTDLKLVAFPKDSSVVEFITNVFGY